MTPRQRRLWKYGLASAVLVILIVGLVVGVEWMSDASDPTAGIDDVLSRELPEDVRRL